MEVKPRIIEYMGKPATMAVMREIRNRKLMEEARRESEEKYRNIFGNAQVGLFRTTITDGKILECNDRYAEMVGYPNRKECVGNQVASPHYMDPSVGQHMLAEIQKTGEVRNFETAFRKRDGSIIWTRYSARMYPENGYIEGVLTDITEEKRAVEALRKSEERLRAIFEAAENVSLIITDVRDPEPLVLEFSPGAEKIFGYKRAEMIGKPVSTLHLPEEETTLVRKSGETFQALFTTYPLFDEKGKIYAALGVSIDISERKRLEAQLIQTQKMEAVGTLAGGIAHDFNNLLTIILGYTDLSQDYAEPGSEIYEHLSEAKKACVRARDLTQQFITFSGGGDPVKEVGSLAKFIEDTTNLTLSGSNVKCEFCLSADLWQVEFDKAQIKHVIANLTRNAKGAMPEGGVIKVSAQNITLEAGKREPGLPVRGGKYVKISIQDRGIGIPEEDLPKVFDPYFSTKDKGVQKGMGLGLSVAHSIIKKHDGHISIESEMGSGTAVYIYLPAFERRISQGKNLEEMAVANKGKVLVMDDEEMVRNVAGEMLSRVGYKIGFAKEGAEAIDLYKRAKESGEPFDGVILDLTIRGGMGGKEAIQKLVEIDPGVKGIVSSGYTSDPALTDFGKHGFVGAISKPYEIDELSKTLHEVIYGSRVSP
jgi:PAS domain S-box-containing protein